MKFPENITLQFFKIDENPIKDLIVFITIIANKKNNYGAGFLKTDSDGKINLLKSEIENIIKKAMNEFVMDYSSTIDDCRDSIIITVEDISELHSRIKRIKKYYPEKAYELESLMKKCSNKLFEPFEIERKVESEIKIKVQSI